jgi:shikimate dehydrogenase
VNVTLPHKVEVMEYLDEIDEGARFIGAVNTIVNDGGRLIGYNTDGIGYVRSLKEETGVSLAGKTLLVIGAGGAARGVVYALAQERPARIVIANRTAERARALAADFARYGSIAGIGLDELDDWKAQVDVVINTTHAGMSPHETKMPMDPSWLRPGMLVSDIIYNPLITMLLKQAEAKGCIIHGGLGMFIYQGAYAFEYWTGRPAPVAAMREAVEQSFVSHT